MRGTSQGTVTDIDGSFMLTVPTGSNTLVISYVGMSAQEVEVRPNVRVVLTEDLGLPYLQDRGVKHEKEAEEIHTLLCAPYSNRVKHVH